MQERGQLVGLRVKDGLLPIKVREWQFNIKLSGGGEEECVNTNFIYNR